MNRKGFLATLGKLVGAMVGLGGAAVADSPKRRLVPGKLTPRPYAVISERSRAKAGKPKPHVWDKPGFYAEGDRYEAGQTISFTPAESGDYTVYVAD